ncbi:MAG: PIN domain-containing protein [Candidatus Omnitrophica bacterium]|nr:PIN domain-containing protein [Candidatus Omnitrophota bacterium]
MKIALDTNVLVRVITVDKEEMVSRARGLIKKYGPKEIFITYGVVLETYYVLKTFYGFDEKGTLGAIRDILNVEQFSFEHEIAVRLALSKAEKGFGFYDALIGEIAGSKNLKTCTFDKGLKNNKNFEVI